MDDLYEEMHALYVRLARVSWMPVISIMEELVGQESTRRLKENNQRLAVDNAWHALEGKGQLASWDSLSELAALVPGRRGCIGRVEQCTAGVLSGLSVGGREAARNCGRHARESGIDRCRARGRAFLTG